MNEIIDIPDDIQAPIEIQSMKPVFELEHVIKKSEVEPETARALMDAYNPIFAEVSELMIAANAAPSVTDATQLKEMEACRNLRLALAKVRVKCDKLLDAMKRDGLRRGKAIQGVYNLLEFMVKPIEENLFASEKFSERAEAARKAELAFKRIAELRPYMDAQFMNIQEMAEPAYAQFLETTKSGHHARIAAQHRAEAERLTKDKEEFEERVRLRAENERLRFEAVARDEEARKALKLSSDKAAKEIESASNPWRNS